MDTTRLVQRNEQRQQKQRKRNNLLLGLAAVAVLAIAAFAFWPRPAYVPEISGRPNLAVEQTMLDFGKRNLNEPVTAVFKLRNTGDEVLQILNDPQVRVAVGCCPPPVKLDSHTLQPGQEVSLSMTFSMHEGMDGPHDFRVLVETNDPTHAQQELTVLSDWGQ